MRYLWLAAILWGSSFPVIGYALRDISPVLFLVLRFALAFLILSAARRSRSSWRLLFRRELILIAIPNALSFLLQFKAQTLTTASKTAVFVNSCPVFVVVLSRYFLKERIEMFQVAAMILALFGVVATSTGLELEPFSVVNVGDAMAVAVGLLWAFFIVFSGPLVRKHAEFELSWALYFWTFVFGLPFLAFEDVRFDPGALPPVLYLAVFPTIVAYFFYLKGVRSVSSLSTAVVIMIEIVVAFLIAHFWLGEAFSLVETCGVLLVLAGVVLASKKPAAPTPRPATPASL